LLFRGSLWAGGRCAGASRARGGRWPRRTRTNCGRCRFTRAGFTAGPRLAGLSAGPGQPPGLWGLEDFQVEPAVAGGGSSRAMGTGLGLPSERGGGDPRWAAHGQGTRVDAEHAGRGHRWCGKLSGGRITQASGTKRLEPGSYWGCGTLGKGTDPRRLLPVFFVQRRAILRWGRGPPNTGYQYKNPGGHGMERPEGPPPHAPGWGPGPNGPPNGPQTSRAQGSWPAPSAGARS